MQSTIKKFYLLCFISTFSLFSFGQYSLPDSNITHEVQLGASLPTSNQLPLNKKRVWIMSGIQASIWAGTFTVLNKAWYAGFARSPFHFYNDFSEWNQMDKAGHLWTSYHISRVSGVMWKWTGLPHTTRTLLAGFNGIAYQSIIEIQDGYSQQWGFSWGDMGANITGAAAYVAQELAWKDQRIQIKLSYSPYHYPNGLNGRRDQLFGRSSGERILKDYNSQKYWISGNLSAFLPVCRFPRWLNFSVGYGSEGLLGGTQNRWLDKTGNPVYRADVQRVRRWFIAPDVDLTKINTRIRLLHTFFSVMNLVKFPAPALELNSKGKLKGHWVYF